MDAGALAGLSSHPGRQTRSTKRGGQAVGAGAGEDVAAGEEPAPVDGGSATPPDTATGGGAPGGGATPPAGV